LTANGTDSAIVDTVEIGRYMPGYSAQAGVGIRIPTLPTGNQYAVWGYLNDNNGLYFGVDSEGIYVAQLSGGVETKTYQSDWNVDPLNGAGPSALTLSLSQGNIFQITFSWYGYGVIEFQLVLADANNRQKVFTVHRFVPSNSVSIQNPNLPIRIEANNDGTATAFNVYIGGRQFSIIGEYVAHERITPAKRLNVTGITTTLTPIISFRRKSGFESIPTRVEDAVLITSGNTLLELYTNSTLTTPSWTSIQGVATTETILEVDYTAATMSGGNLDYSALVQASGSGGFRGGSVTLQGLSLPLPLMQPVTLAARSLSGTVDVSAILTMFEEW